MKFLKACVLMGAVFLAGCASTITARPGGDSGIPYYLPRPYLLVAKNLCPVQTKTTVTKEDKKAVVTAEPFTICDKDKDNIITAVGSAIPQIAGVLKSTTPEAEALPRIEAKEAELWLYTI